MAIVVQVLREHQRQGVQFVFDCLMGLRDYNGCGCILADDMGLGKTLQSVQANIFSQSTFIIFVFI